MSNLYNYLQVHEVCIMCITCLNIDKQYTVFDIIQSNVYNLLKCYFRVYIAMFLYI